MALHLKAVSEPRSFHVVPVLFDKATREAASGFLATKTYADLRETTDTARAFFVLCQGIKGLPPGPPPRETDGFENAELGREHSKHLAALRDWKEQSFLSDGVYEDGQRAVISDYLRRSGIDAP